MEFSGGGECFRVGSIGMEIAGVEFTWNQRYYWKVVCKKIKLDSLTLEMTVAMENLINWMKIF